MNLQQIFTTRLKDARTRRKLSQEALGIAIGLDESVASTRINRYENKVYFTKWNFLQTKFVKRDDEVIKPQFLRAKRC